MKKIVWAALLALLAAPGPAEAAEKLRLGLLPIADTLLLRVAAKDGYFAEQGLEAELISFQSALEKDAAAAAGQLDGYFCELISVIVHRAAGLDFVVAAATSHTGPETRWFGLATAPGFQGGLDGLKGRGLAVGRQTIVDFMADVLLEEAGRPADFMERRDIRKIPIRLQMLLTGQIEAALLPEPLLSIAEKEGGRVLLDDRGLDMPLALVALSGAKASPATVRALQAALAKAAEAINRDPAAYLPLMTEAGLIPPQLAETYLPPRSDLTKIPRRLPDRALFEAYTAYLIKTGVLAAPGSSGSRAPFPPAYEETVWSDPAEAGSAEAGSAGTGSAGTGSAETR